MDRLLTWCDLEVRSECTEPATIPPELRAEIHRREEALAGDTGEKFEPMRLVEFNAYEAITLRSVVLREDDLYGTIGGNIDNIERTAPEGSRLDLLVRRGTL